MAIIADAAGLHRTRAGHDDMGAMSRVVDKDEELGKRDDDYSRLAKGGGSRWLPRPRRRRLFLTLVFVAVVWMLFRVLPENETLKGTSNRILHPLGDGERTGDTLQDHIEDAGVVPKSAPPKKADPLDSAEQHSYSGKIRFLQLSKTLHKISRTMGFRQWNNNVLFASSSMKSLAALVSMACEMRKYERNDVHIGLFGRNNLTIEELRELHGLNDENCDIYWHDARPDNAPYSTELRAENAVLAAFRNIETYMHPQVIITDDLEREDAFFSRAIKRETTIHNHPVISIPRDSADQLMWMSRLDVEPLREWHYPSIEILVHVPPDSIGSLRRLMRCLEEADYAGLGYPRLTIEVPADLDSIMRRFLEQVRWPPRQPSPMAYTNMLTIRHRIPNTKISADEASFRFVESFFPSNPVHEHVLVLSANAQLSPLYYHYVKYAISQYQISDRGSRDAHNLLGIALDLPSVALDGTTRFKLPTGSQLPNDSEVQAPEDSKIPFLWEGPSSGAALYFGDKWAEIHSFITNRIAARDSISPREKIVSPVFPSWLEFVLELARARGYGMLYPALLDEATLATVHRESSQIPEEFQGKPMHDTFEPYATPSQIPKPLAEDRNEQKLLPPGRPLHEVLPFDGDFPSPLDLPFLSYTGVNRTRSDAFEAAKEFAHAFRRDYGGCQNDVRFKSGRKRKMEQCFARDLFCWGDETDNDYVAAKPKIEAEDPLLVDDLPGESTSAGSKPTSTTSAPSVETGDAKDGADAPKKQVAETQTPPPAAKEIK